jgi:hypothetical protein
MGRLRHVVVLARALWLAPDDERIRKALHAHLRSFVAQNPAERGVHWYSNLEISLRAIALSQILAITRYLDRDVASVAGQLLYHSGWHLMADLPYTATTMRNNHLVGDAVGLTVCGLSYPGKKGPEWWARAGDGILGHHLTNHTDVRGATVEDSVSYQRFILELLVVRAILPDAPAVVRDRMVAVAQRLARYGAIAGPVPQIGDWDEGRALATVVDDPHDLSGSVRLALSLGGSGAPPAWREAHEEVCWYTGEGIPIEPAAPEAGGNDLGGGVARSEAGEFVTWLKAGHRASHGHADLCSTAVSVAGQWVVGDPGTGTYNGSIEQRNYFRSSVAHSVLRLRGVDQLGPERVFRWRYDAQGGIGAPVRHGDVTVMWGWHNAYRRLEGAPRVVRAVITCPGMATVADWTDAPPGTAYQLSLPLGPEVEWRAGSLAVPGQAALALDVPTEPSAVHGQPDPFDGWWSDTYGSIRPATRLELSGKLLHPDSPVCWTVRRPSLHAPYTDDRAVIFGDSCVTVGWGARHAYLEVAHPHGRQTAIAAT